MIDTCNAWIMLYGYDALGRSAKTFDASIVDVPVGDLKEAVGRPVWDEDE